MSENKLPDWIADHLRQYISTDGEQGHYLDMTANGGKSQTPNLLLTTIGRKSGRVLTLPLIYGVDGENHIIVASKGGAPEHPAWYINLQASPDVAQIQVVDKKFRVKARVAAGEERTRLWKLMTEIYPPYPSYQEKTDREIPVVVLETVKP